MVMVMANGCFSDNALLALLDCNSSSSFLMTFVFQFSQLFVFIREIPQDQEEVLFFCENMS